MYYYRSRVLVLQHDKVDVQVVATASSLHFYDWQSIEKEHEGRVKVWRDEDEWQVSLCSSFRGVASRPATGELTEQSYPLIHQGWSKIGDPILHIEVN